MVAFMARTEGVSVSFHYVAKLWRDNGIRPHRHGTFKVSKDPEFAEKGMSMIVVAPVATWTLLVLPGWL
ncbi:MAG TPA: hypothetical protein VGP60_17585, partial [Amycolatopsis sp.]|nr:hypothetical protein [Amycolatopsis sp.]